MLSSVACLALHYFSALPYKRPDFRENVYWTKKCGFWFFLQLLSETFFSLRRIQWDLIVNLRSVHVKYPSFLSDFNETWIFLTDFRKIHIYKISWKSVQRDSSCSIRTDRQTCPCNFANTPIKDLKWDGLKNGFIWLRMGVREQAVVSAAMNLRVP